jgi:predicted esterase
MRWFSVALLLLSLLVAPGAGAEPRTHVVASGHTLGKIARRYKISIDDLCKANGISRRDPIKPGQKLLIPDRNGKVEAPREPAKQEEPEESDEPKAEAKPEPEAGPHTQRVGSDGMRVIDVPGAGPAYFYEPIGAGRKSLKPVLVYLHGRGGAPQQDCRRWAPVARRLGWLVCPAGPGPRGDGRGWNNNWVTGQRAAVGAIQALRQKYGRRVQLRGNTLIGFSEGAYVAMNVGVREPRTFNRLLILAADNDYWGGAGLEALKKAARTLKRVYLITGEQDGVIEGTQQVREWFKSAGVSTRLSTPKDMGHEVALERKAGMYRAALVWLDRG